MSLLPFYWMHFLYCHCYWHWWCSCVLDIFNICCRIFFWYVCFLTKIQTFFYRQMESRQWYVAYISDNSLMCCLFQHQRPSCSTNLNLCHTFPSHIFHKMKIWNDKDNFKWSNATCMRIRKENSACQAFRVKLKTRQEEEQEEKQRCQSKKEINTTSMQVDKTWWQTARTDI